MRIDYDATKNETNIRQRGLPFDRVAELDWESALVGRDRRRDYGEDRLVALGSLQGRVHVVCFIAITGGIRVISFRKANAREVHRFETAHR